jgi:hypothetical protein
MKWRKNIEIKKDKRGQKKTENGGDYERGGT